MAVIICRELWEGRSGSSDWTNRRRYDRVYEVYTDDDNDNVATVLAADLLPRRGDPHPEDETAYLANLAAEQDAAYPKLWKVTLEYDSQPGGDDTANGDDAQKETLQPNTTEGGSLPSGDGGSLGGTSGGGSLGGAPNDGAMGSQTSAPGGSQSPGQRPENPLERPTAISGSFQQTTEVLREAFKTDDDGKNVPGTKAVLNSAGMMFDPPVTIEASRPMLKLAKNYAQLYLANVCELQDAVNSKEWMGFQPRVVRCVGVEYEAVFDSGGGYWKVTYNLAVKWDGWEIRVLDAGLYERWQIGTDAATGKPVYEWRAIRDKHGEPITEPVPFNGEGKQKKPDDPETYLLFSAYKQRDFNKLMPGVRV